jgi:hypothetical protein
LDNLHLRRPTSELAEGLDRRSNGGGLASIEDQAPTVDGTYRAVTCTTGTPDLIPDDVAALVEASIATARRAWDPPIS